MKKRKKNRVIFILSKKMSLIHLMGGDTLTNSIHPPRRTVFDCHQSSQHTPTTACYFFPNTCQGGEKKFCFQRSVL